MRLLLCISLFCVQSFGASYYVDATAGSNGNNGTSTGTPWKTLLKAQTNAVANDSVFLKKGEIWYEAWTNTVNGVVLDAYGTGSNPILDGGASNRWGVLCLSSNTITRNLYIRNFSGAASPNDTGALWQNNSSGTNTITDSVLDHHILDDGVGANDGWSIVQRCSIINCDDQGITQHGNGNAVIESCTISNCLEAFENSAGPVRLIVNDCIMVNNRTSDVDALDQCNSVFNRCWFKGQANGGALRFFRASGSNTVFNYCLFDASASTNITTSQFTVDGPTVANNCVFYGGVSGNGAMTIDAGGTLAMTNSIISSWWRAAFITDPGTFTMNHCIYNNNTISNATLVVNQVGTADPKFLVPTTGDFRLQSTSPAIRTGIGIGLTMDLSGHGVGFPPSLGVYEYGTAMMYGNISLGGVVIVR